MSNNNCLWSLKMCVVESVADGDIAGIKQHIYQMSDGLVHFHLANTLLRNDSNELNLNLSARIYP